MPADSTLLSLPRLRRVLRLADSASKADLEREGRRLLDHLEQRQAALPQDSEAARALREERATLARSLAHWNGPARSPRTGRRASAARPAGSRWGRPLRNTLILTLIACLLGAWMAGLRITRSAGDEDPAGEDGARSGRLIVEGRPRGAELRIRNPDSEELLLKIPAEGARLELQAGRYALEVAREDCPDSWHHLLELAAGETRQFDPTICEGEARLIVRSNVLDDRLRIDGFDYGATRPEAHVLSVGEHTFRVDKEGYAPFEGKVRLEPEQELEVRAELEPLDAGPARKGRPLPFEHTPPSPPPPSASSSPTPATDSDAIPPLDLKLPPLAMPKRLLFLEDARGQRPRGGSTTWHDAVSRQMVSRYDRDGSGRLDRVEESEAVPCEIWQEIERDFDEGGLGLSMSRNYGFDGSEWIEGALGFSRPIRSAVHARMKECGLRP